MFKKKKRLFQKIVKNFFFFLHLAVFADRIVLWFDLVFPSAGTI